MDDIKATGSFFLVIVYHQLFPWLSPQWAKPYIDLGASNHMLGVSFKSGLSLYKYDNPHILTANGEKMDILGVQNLEFLSLKPTDVFLVHILTSNLISSWSIIG